MTKQPPEHIDSIIERWRKRQEVLMRLDATVRAASLIEEMLADLEVIASSESDELNLTDAAQVSGYSADHLGRMVRAGTLTNYGHRGSPRIRRSELPKRAKPRLPKGAHAPYDARTDARLSLGVRR